MRSRPANGNRRRTIISNHSSPQLRWSARYSGARRGIAWVVTAAGRISAATAGGLVDAVIEPLTAGERLIIVDLDRVDYISSAGLIALDALAGRIALASAALVVCGVRPPVRLAFELAGFLDRFDIETSVDEARARVQSLQTRG